MTKSSDIEQQIKDRESKNLEYSKNIEIQIRDKQTGLKKLTEQHEAEISRLKVILEETRYSENSETIERLDRYLATIDLHIYTSKDSRFKLIPFRYGKDEKRGYCAISWSTSLVNMKNSIHVELYNIGLDSTTGGWRTIVIDKNVIQRIKNKHFNNKGFSSKKMNDDMKLKFEYMRSMLEEAYTDTLSDFESHILKKCIGSLMKNHLTKLAKINTLSNQFGI